MTKKDLAQFLAKRSGLAASICEALLTEAVAGIVEALSQGGAVNLEGLGTLRLDKFPDERGNRLRFDPAPEVAEFLKAGYAKVGHTEVLVGQHTPFTSAPTAIVPAVPKPAGGDEPGEPAEPIDPSKAAEELESLFSTEKDHSANPYLDPDEPPKAPVLAGAQAQAQGNKEEAKPAEADEETNLSSFAADILELGAQELARGLGLAAESNPVAQGRRLTFPVQISPQAKEASARRWRPADGDERRSFKELTLKNFFLSLGSIVRDRNTREPLIVFDVAEKHEEAGERYVIRLLRVSGAQPPAKSEAGAPRAHHFKFLEIDFDWNRHEPMMVIDEKVGPRVHAFEIGSFREANRRPRAEVILAAEYEAYMTRRSGLYKPAGGA